MSTLGYNTIVIAVVLFFFALNSPINADGNTGWHSLETDYFTIQYQQHDKNFAEDIANDLIKMIETFQMSVSCYPNIKAKINVSPNKQYYQNLITPNRGIEKQSEAFYSKIEKEIYIRNPRNLKNFGRLKQIVLHEYIHFFVDSIFEGAPLWFDEGMAVYFSGELTFDKEIRYATDTLLGNRLRITEMRNYYPENQALWDTFYAKSALAVKYLVNNRKEEFYQLWDDQDNRTKFSIKFFQAFKMTETEYSILLEETLNKRFKIELLLASTGIIWSLLPIVLFIAWLKKRWRAKRIRKEWESQDNNRPDDNDELSISTD